VEIPPYHVNDLSEIEPAYQELLAFWKKYSPHPWSTPEADLSLSHVKLFIEGMLPNKNNVIATLSFQWSAKAANISSLFYSAIGENCFKNELETHGKFYDAGVTIAYGNDWPSDPLNEWYSLQCALTRRIRANPARMNRDRNLSVSEVLRSATIDAAYALQAERYIGSLEVGKFADMIVLNKNVFNISPETFARTKVLRTILGGKTVFLRE
jgi:predicted amidohydrolase YtcJ